MWTRLCALGVLLAFFLFIQACGRRPEPQEACHFVQNSQYQRVSWKGQVPIGFDLHQSVPSRHILAIEAAAEEWKRRLGRELFNIRLTGVAGADEPSKDGVSMIYWLNHWEADRGTEQARTTVYWTGNRIYEADIRVNGANFLFYDGDGTEAFSGVDVTSLLVHELGHVLGLAHIEKLPSVMAYSLKSGTLRRTPTQVDLDSVHCEYE